MELSLNVADSVIQSDADSVFSRESDSVDDGVTRAVFVELTNSDMVMVRSGVNVAESVGIRDGVLGCVSVTRYVLVMVDNSL